jgi:hypothetical protein
MRAVGQAEIEKLPDPFPAWCPDWGYNAAYAKSMVRSHIKKTANLDF